MKNYIKEILLVIIIVLLIVVYDKLNMIQADTAAQTTRIESNQKIMIEDYLKKIQISTSLMEYKILD